MSPYGHTNYALKPLHLYLTKNSFASRFYRKAVIKKISRGVDYRFGLGIRRIKSLPYAKITEIQSNEITG